MLGHKPKLFKVHTTIFLDDLVPQNNCYRKLEAKVDLSFIRDLIKDCYASTIGRLLQQPGRLRIRSAIRHLAKPLSLDQLRILVQRYLGG